VLYATQPCSYIVGPDVAPLRYATENKTIEKLASLAFLILFSKARFARFFFFFFLFLTATLLIESLLYFDFFFFFLLENIMEDKTQYDIDCVLLQPIDTNGYATQEHQIERLVQDGWPQDQARILVIARNKIRDVMADLNNIIEG
jgi:hypothetical protein